MAVTPAATLIEGLRRLPAQGPVQLGRCLAVLELEEGNDDAEAAHAQASLYPLLRDSFDRLGCATSMDALLATAAEEARRLTGFDRMLIYRFEENWAGAVVAEDRNDRLPSYLDLRFPASDIPAQARRAAGGGVRLLGSAALLAVPAVVLAQPEPGTGTILVDAVRALDWPAREDLFLWVVRSPPPPAPSASMRGRSADWTAAASSSPATGSADSARPNTPCATTTRQRGRSRRVPVNPDRTLSLPSPGPCRGYRPLPLPRSSGR